jgi:putative heme transporter
MTDGALTPDDSAVDQPRVRHVEIPLSALIVLGLIVVATVLVLRAIDRTQQVIALAVLAAIVSAVVAPLVEVVRRFIGRTAAVVVVHLVLFVALAAGTGVVLQQIRSEADSLAAFAEEQIEEVDGEPSEILQQSRLDDRLGDAAANWGTSAIIGDDDAASIATRVSELTIVTVLSIFFMLQGGAIIDVAMSMTDDRRRRRRLRAMWRLGVAAGSTYLRRSLAVAMVSGVAASGVAAAFGLPAIVLIGVWAGLLSAVPLLGTVVGWAPIVVIAIVETSTPSAIAVTAIAVGAVIGVNVLRARFVRPSVKPGSFLIAMSIASGLTVAGLPGAAAAMFATVALVAVVARPPDLGDEDEIVSVVGDEEPRLSPAALEDLTDRSLGSGRAGDTVDDGGASRSASQPLRLTLSRRTAAQITGFVILAFVVQLAITRVGPILVWAVVGALIAVGLDRPVSWAERKLHLRRAVVVIVSSILVAGVIATLVIAATGSVGDTRPMSDGIPEFVEALSDLPLVGDSIDADRLEAEIDRFQRDLPRLITRSPLADQAVGLLGGGLIGAFWVILAALTCLLDGPRLVAAIDRRTPARITRQVTRLAQVGKVALGGYVAGAAVVAAMNGGLVLLLGAAIGVPMVFLLALWAFGWNFIPQVGAIIGWAPLLLLAVLQSPLRGAACLLFFVVYQVIENNAIQPTIVGNAVDIGALAALGAALTGAALAGLIGAALAIPLAGVARALYLESRRDDFPSIRSSFDPPDAARELP